MPSSETPEITESDDARLRVAPSRPNETPSTLARAMPSRLSHAVTTSPWRTMSATGDDEMPPVPDVASEVPKLPCSAPPSQLKYCTSNGRSRPNW